MTNIHDDIIKTAKNLFIKHGLRSISIDDICNELHISKKAFYAYFKQKKDLIVEILIMIHEEKVHSRKNKFNEFNHSQNIIDLILTKSPLFFSMHEKLFVNVIYDLEKYYPQIMKKYSESTFNDIYIGAIKILQRGIEENLFREDIDIENSAIFISMIIRSFPNWEKQHKMSINEFSNIITDTFIRMCVNEKGMKYYLQKKEDIDNKKQKRNKIQEKYDN